jgi:leucyl aminopeptidase
MMKTVVRALPPAKATTDLVVIPVCEEKHLLKEASTLLSELTGAIPPQVATKVFSGKRGQSVLVPSINGSGQLVLALGLGFRSDLTREGLRKFGALAIAGACSARSKTVACLEPDPEYAGSAIPKEIIRSEDVAQCIVEGALLATYRYDKYRTRNADEKFIPTEFQLVCGLPARIQALTRGAALARTTCEGVFLARDLANAPGNEMYPEALARVARRVGRRCGVKVKVLEERRISTLGMGGLIGVAQGSARPPRFIIMEYAPRKARNQAKTLVLVGKGVTFDSGGISIKPAANMAEMKMDMSGAAAVIGTLQAASRLHLPVRIVGLLPVTENLPGGRALKPGDILKHLNGMTSEIDNTDAEGRLILADALVYAARYSPDLVIDLATLTGAVVVALGHVTTGMLGNAEQAMMQLEEAGQRTYERVWQLPLYAEYERLIKSDVADVKNTGGRWAGAITGAMFLKQFTGTYPWVHLDIAGTAIMEEATEYIPKGGSGVGVRLLLDFLQHWNNH